MCGIVGYVGSGIALPVLLEGLKRLEYRGYDSAGLALLATNSSQQPKIQVTKTLGKVANLEHSFSTSDTPSASIGIAHTRWATHGAVTHENAHPHVSESKRFAIVHNGIIENYKVLAQHLAERESPVHSDTDTAVLVQFIAHLVESQGASVEDAFRATLQQVNGTYGLVLLDQEAPDRLYIACNGSPIVIGIGDDARYVSSDKLGFIAHTNEVLYLEDKEYTVLEKENPVVVKSIFEDKNIERESQTLSMQLELAEKGQFDYFMEKEIYEQANVLEKAMAGRVQGNPFGIRISGIEMHKNRFLTAPRIIVVACGTSWHVGLIAEYVIEELARLPVEVEYASEFRYRNPVINERDIVIAISQSGETADTLAAARLAKERGAFVFAICNVVGSSLARISDSGIYAHAGPEIGVASTKAFTAQVFVLTMLGLEIGHLRGFLSNDTYAGYIGELVVLPAKIEKTLECAGSIRRIAERYKDSKNFLYLGRGLQFPVALEGALKLKEISYIHAEGYPAAEIKHGIIALIDKDMPVLFLAMQIERQYDKVINNLQQVHARGGRIISIMNEADPAIDDFLEERIYIPRVSEIFLPLISVIPLQLFAFHVSVLRGTNVDQPRNLAKSVTVE